MFEPKYRELIWSISVHDSISLTRFLQFEKDKPRDVKGFFLHKIEKFEGIEPDFKKENYKPTFGEWCFFDVVGFPTLLKFEKMISDKWYRVSTHTGETYNSTACQKIECDIPDSIKTIIEGGQK